MGLKLYIGTGVERTGATAPTSIYGKWLMKIAVSPTFGGMSADSDNPPSVTLVLMNRIDMNGVDRTVYLDSYEIGDTIRTTAVNFNNSTCNYIITDISKPIPDIWMFTVSGGDTGFPNLADEPYLVLGSVVSESYGKADLYDDENTTLNRVILTEKGLDNSVKNFTRDFSIPASSTNNFLLKHWEVKSNESTIDPNKAIPARLDIAGVYIIKGQIELLSVTWKNRKPYSYKIVFYGAESGLVAQFGDMLLSDVDWSNFDFTWGATTVNDSWVYRGQNYFIPILSWNRLYVWNETGTGLNDIRAAATGVLNSELRVGLLLSDMVKSIGEMVGITFLFNQRVTDFIDELFVIPSKYANQALVVSIPSFSTSVETSTPITVPNAVENTIVMDVINFDPRNRWDGTSQYTTEFVGNYTFQVTYQRVDGTGATKWDCYLRRVSDDALMVTDASASAESGTFELSAALAENTAYYFTVECDKNGTTAEFQMETTSIPVSQFGQPNVVNDNMPTVPVVDFLRGFMESFNLLLIQTDLLEYTFTDTVSLYSEGFPPIDLEDYINEVELTYKKIDVFERINFSHKENQSIQNSLYKDTAGREFASLIFESNKDFSDGSLERESIFSVFPPSYVQRVEGDGTIIGQTDIWCHAQLSIDSPPKALLANFLLMYRNGTKPTLYPYYLETDVEVFTQQTTYGAYSMAQGDVITSASNSITYDNERTFNNITPVNDITEIFWVDWLAQLYKKTAYTLDITFPIRFGVYLKITDNNTIYLNGFYHFMAAWKYETGKESLTVRLFRFDKLSLGTNFTELRRGGNMRLLGKDF